MAAAVKELLELSAAAVCGAAESVADDGPDGALPEGEGGCGSAVATAAASEPGCRCPCAT